MNDDKREYAELLLRMPNDAFSAALTLYPNDTGKALQIASEWPIDPEIKTYQGELLAEHGEIAFLPNKSCLAREIWKRTNETPYLDDFIKGARLYAEVMGFMPDQRSLLNVNNQPQFKVVLSEDDYNL